MDPCVFCKVAKGELPNHTVYEDDQVLAFLDIYPSVEGFTLVVPKNHYAFVWDMPESEYVGLKKVVKRVAERINEVMQPARVGEQIEGLDVEHAHVKVFPFATAKDFRRAPDRSLEPNHEKLAAVAEKLKF